MKTNKISVTYIISDIDRALAFEWIALGIDRNKFDVSFILLNPGDSQLEEFLIYHKIITYRVTYRNKKDIFSALYHVTKILRKIKPQIIHAHLFDASLIGLLAGKLVGVKKRIFTRHHGNQHHAYFPRAVYYDKIINALATHIIAPSFSVKSILTKLEEVLSSKVSVINHGFDLSYFGRADENTIVDLKKKYNPENKSPVIGVISRYTELKGIQYIIPAFKRLLEHYPNAFLILANAGGDFQDQIRELLNQLDPKSYTEILFESDISTLYKLFDVFIHASIEPSSEAFGQTYVEALATEVPSVFTLSGVATEFIEDHKNALVVPFKNTDAIFYAVKEILENEDLRNTLKENGKNIVFSKFKLSNMIKNLENLYKS